MNMIQTIAAAIAALHNCEKSGNLEWLDIWNDRLDAIERNHLPYGSGFDSGTTIDRDNSTADKIVLVTSFHHMNENGYYDGWTDHKIIAEPSFIGGLRLRVTGRDRNGIKDYIGDAFYHALTVETE